jgi:hypothetical protein
MEKIDDQKYIVFKRNDFYEMMGKLALPPYFGETGTGRKEVAGKHWNCAPIAEEIKATAERTCLPDAVVIRRQDVFAPPALDAYANAIQVVVEMSQGSSVNGASLEHLREVADYFHEQACKAWECQRKLPD